MPAGSLNCWSRCAIDPPRTLLQAGAPSPMIAANLSHSDTRMIERHYAHLVPSHARRPGHLRDDVETRAR
jgi:hypothetical protein